MQAARGTSLNDDRARDARVPRRRARLLFVGLAALVYALDQVTKVLAVARLSDGDVALPGGWLTLHLVRNPGAAFSTGTEYTVVLTCFAIAATVAVLWVARRLADLWWAVALGLLLAGVTGNLTDRLLRAPGPLRGHVVDFLQLPSWPVFNVADMAINVAAALIVLQAFRGTRVDGTRPEAEPDADSEADAGSETEAETVSEPGRERDGDGT